MFPIIELPDSALLYWEQLGTKKKFWCDNQGTLSLCKVGRPNTGEDWAEKLAAELAELLGLPHAEYELAIWEGKRCVISPSILPADSSLITGNELLGGRQPTDTNAVRFKQSAHTWDAILDALGESACELPLNWNAPPGVRTASDVFIGYLLLDTLIGNTDRHDENWALIEAVNRRYLAPTFDHACSLGCHETDRKREMRLITKDMGYSVEAYADRSRSAIYPASGSGQKLLNLDALTLASRRSGAIQVWLDKLSAINDSRIDILLSGVPSDRMSNMAAAFVRRMLIHNRNRILVSGSIL